MKYSQLFNWLWSWARNSLDFKTPLKKLWCIAFLFLSSYQQWVAQTLENDTTDSVDYEMVDKPTITWSPVSDSLQGICDQLLQSVLNQDHYVFEENEGVNINTILFLDSYSDDEWFKSRLALWDQNNTAKHILDLKLDSRTGEIYYSTSQNYEQPSSFSDEKLIEWYRMLLKKTGLLVPSKNLRLSPKTPRKIIKL